MMRHSDERAHAVLPAIGRRRRRGSTYVMVLSVATTVTVIGLAGLAATRVNTRRVADTADWAEAQTLAFAAAEHACRQIDRDPNWRSTYASSGVSAALGRGTFAWRVIDPADGDLAGDPQDRAAAIATGTVNDATYTLRLALVPTGAPLGALAACIAADSRIEVKRRRAVKLDDGVLSSNDRLTNKGVIDGDVEAAKIKGSGTVTGTVTVPAPPKAMPDAGTFDAYRDVATALPRLREIKRAVLSPASNPWGTPNADGVYYIDTGNRNLTITGTRIHGTLVVKCGRKRKVVVDAAVFMHNYRQDHPVLIVDGDVELACDSADTDLRESTWRTNFNPPGTPYDGAADGDQRDSYPNEIRGLVHVKGKLKMRSTARVRGAIICEGSVTFDGNNQIIHDPDVLATPPSGYTTGGDAVQHDGWTRVVQ